VSLANITSLEIQMIVLIRKKERNNIMMKREKGGITWSDVGKDPKEQCRSQHGGCALPCHPLSSQAPLVKMLLLYLLACAYASPKLCACCFDEANRCPQPSLYSDISVSN
jgi:hypothetical protein